VPALAGGLEPNRNAGAAPELDTPKLKPAEGDALPTDMPACVLIAHGEVQARPNKSQSEQKGVRVQYLSAEAATRAAIPGTTLGQPPPTW